MKIGILTYHRARNYGAFLQAISLCRRPNMENGIEAEIIDFDTLKAKKAYEVRLWPIKKLYHFKNYIFNRKMKDAFERGYKKVETNFSNQKLVSDSLDNFQELVRDKYDVVVVGSDEVWNVNSIRGFAKPYFLVGNLGCRKFSYAVSSRSDFSLLNRTDHEVLTNSLKDFEFISVRDSITYQQILEEGVSQEKLIISCDPSFLYDFNSQKRDVQELIKKKRINRRKKNILVLCENKKITRSICRELGKDYNLISAAIKTDGYICEPDLDPFEWMDLINSVDFVISSFFHGVCYSIINNTPFIAVGSSPSRRSKLTELLKDTYMEERLIDVTNVTDIEWSKLINIHSTNNDFRAFVLEKRKSFDDYLKRLVSNE